MGTGSDEFGIYGLQADPAAPVVALVDRHANAVRDHDAATGRPAALIAPLWALTLGGEARGLGAALGALPRLSDPVGSLIAQSIFGASAAALLARQVSLVARLLRPAKLAA